MNILVAFERKVTKNGAYYDSVTVQGDARASARLYNFQNLTESEKLKFCTELLRKQLKNDSYTATRVVFHGTLKGAKIYEVHFLNTL